MLTFKVGVRGQAAGEATRRSRYNGPSRVAIEHVKVKESRLVNEARYFETCCHCNKGYSAQDFVRYTVLRSIEYITPLSFPYRTSSSRTPRSPHNRPLQRSQTIH